MAQGSVGGGSQNNWKTQGTIYLTLPSGVPFGKTRPTQTRNDSECWVADTPVTWETDVNQAEASRANVGGIDMLVTFDADGKTIDEYHPVITFFNEVMNRLMKDGFKNEIMNLDRHHQTNAIKVWNYLKDKYNI